MRRRMLRYSFDSTLMPRVDHTSNEAIGKEPIIYNFMRMKPKRKLNSHKASSTKLAALFLKKLDQQGGKP